MDEQKAYLLGLKSFTSKKSGNECYLAKVVIHSSDENRNSIGHFSVVDVFVKAEQFNDLYSNFEPFMVLNVICSVNGSRAFWDIAS